MAWCEILNKKFKWWWSTMRKFRILEYLSQTNNNFDFIEEDLRYKYFDDASILEIFNLLSIGIARHNQKPYVPFNITNHNQFIPAEYLESQQYLERISQWTDENQMGLNTEISIAMFSILLKIISLPLTSHTREAILK